MSVNKVILVGNLGRDGGLYVRASYGGRVDSWIGRAGGGLRISNDMPEAGGGGSAATAAPAASDDGGGGDGGDPDPEPEPRPSPRPSSRPAPALLSLLAISGRCSLGRSRIYALINEGQFPPPVKIGRSSRWVEAEVDAWIASRIQERATSAA